MVAAPTRTVLRKPEVELGDYLCGGQADRHRREGQRRRPLLSLGIPGGAPSQVAQRVRSGVRHLEQRRLRLGRSSVAERATPGNEAIFSTNLITEGGDASLPDGLHTWFYTLIRQADGAWRLVGGGSGP